MKKKLINLCVALALIITGAISLGLKGTNPLAHSGMTANHKIENLGELYGIVDCIQDSFDTLSISENAECQSATIHVNMTEKIRYSYGYSGKNGNFMFFGKSGDSYALAEQEITCYATTEGIYVESKCILYINASDEITILNHNFSKILLQYDINIYLTDEKCYIKINDYNIANSTFSKIIKSEYTNKWIEASYDMVSTVYPFDVEMTFVLDIILEAYQSLLDASLIKDTDTSVSLDESTLSGLIDPMYDIFKVSIDNISMNVEFDLLDKTRPHIVIGAGINHKNSKDSEELKGHVKNKLKSTVDVVIYNVNNTFIDENFFDFVITKEFEAYEDFEDIFVTQEYEVD